MTTENPAVAYIIGEHTFCAGCWLIVKPGTAHTCAGLDRLLADAGPDVVLKVERGG